MPWAASADSDRSAWAMSVVVAFGSARVVARVAASAEIRPLITAVPVRAMTAAVGAIDGATARGISVAVATDAGSETTVPSAGLSCGETINADAVTTPPDRIPTANPTARRADARLTVTPRTNLALQLGHFHVPSATGIPHDGQ